MINSTISAEGSLGHGRHRQQGRQQPSGGEDLRTRDQRWRNATRQDVSRLASPNSAFSPQSPRPRMMPQQSIILQPHKPNRENALMPPLVVSAVPGNKSDIVDDRFADTSNATMLHKGFNNNVRRFRSAFDRRTRNSKEVDDSLLESSLDSMDDRKVPPQPSRATDVAPATTAAAAMRQEPAANTHIYKSHRVDRLTPNRQPKVRTKTKWQRPSRLNSPTNVELDSHQGAGGPDSSSPNMVAPAKLQPPQPQDFEDTLFVRPPIARLPNGLPEISLSPPQSKFVRRSRDDTRPTRFPTVLQEQEDPPPLSRLQAILDEVQPIFVSHLSLSDLSDDGSAPTLVGSISSATDTEASVELIRQVFPDVTDDHVITLLNHGSLNDIMNILAEESTRAHLLPSEIVSPCVSSLRAPVVHAQFPLEGHNQAPPLDPMQDQRQNQTRARRASNSILIPTLHRPSNSISKRQGDTTTATISALEQVLEIFPSTSESRILELLRQHSLSTAVAILAAESNG